MRAQETLRNKNRIENNTIKIQPARIGSVEVSNKPVNKYTNYIQI